MISRTTFCSAHAATQSFELARPNAIHLPEAIGFGLDDVEDPLGVRTSLRA
jgi:hypothetical protein